MKTNIKDLLTDDQKAASLTVLKYIGLWASMDIKDTKDLLPEFTIKLNNSFGLLNFKSDHILLSKYENEDSEDLLNLIISTMPDNTKPWFVVETYMMVAAAGQISERSMQIALLYCQKMGISEQEYLEIIQSAYNMTDGI